MGHDRDERAGAAGGVVTPDAVALDLPVATVGTRGIAFMIDAAIVGVTLLLLNLARTGLGGDGFVDGWFGIALVLLLIFVAQFGYTATFETLWRGRTPGKAALGLRVLTVEGAPVGFRHAALRTVIAPLELTGTAGGIAVISALVSPRQQRLGDLLAGTVVVRERRVASAPTVQRFVPPAGYERYVDTLDVSAVGPREYGTIRDALRRLPELPPDAARRISEEIATAVRARVQPPPPAGIDAASYLACVAAAVQQRPSGPASGPSERGRTSEPTEADWGAARPASAPVTAPCEADVEGGFAPPS